MKFFNECKSEEEAKALFRKLAKHFHPDMQGDNDLMIELKKQFDNFKPNLPNFKFNTIINDNINGYEHPYTEDYYKKEVFKLREKLRNQEFSTNVNSAWTSQRQNDFLTEIRTRDIQIKTLIKLSQDYEFEIESYKKEINQLKKPRSLLQIIMDISWIKKCLRI